MNRPPQPDDARVTNVPWTTPQTPDSPFDELPPMTPEQVRLVFGLHDALCLKQLSGAELPTPEQNQTGSARE